MADSQSTIALNIGSQRITMAAFSPQKGGGLVLKKYQEVDILADPAAESMRNAEVRGAVAQLAKALKTGKDKVRAAVPGHSVITKFVKLPPIDSDDLTELVELEAQQQIPFPLTEGAWDWAAIESGGIEKEVLLVAIRQEVLDDISESVSGAGLSLKEVDAAPTALYNAFRFNYPDVTEPVLLVDIGAKSTELIYIEGKKVFIQGVNSPGTTGASLTSSIAKEFGVGFAEAEGHKVSSGVVSLGYTEGMDEATAALASHIRNAVNRLPGEISRRTNFYRSQQGGNAPTKVFLAGGGANLGNLVDFLQEKLSLPVEAFNPLRRVQLADESLAAKAHQLGELVGLAVEGAGKAELHIDLVPTSVGAQRASARRKPWLLGAAGILLAGLGAWAGTKFVAAGAAAEKVQEISDRRDELAPYAGTLRQWDNAIAEIEAIGGEYADFQESRTQWVGILNELRGYFASETVWITELRPYVNYVPGEADSGKSYAKGGFERLAYGETFVDSKSQEARNYEGTPAFNAIRIDGFWRSGVDGKDHRAVNEVLERIKKSVQAANAAAEESGAEPETYFQLTKPDLDSRDGVLPLKDGEILINNNTTLAEETFGAPFTMILPLREPVAFAEVTNGKTL
ncbi:Amuc_1101 family PilM-like pilus complex protein [Roseibacillus ishigakijimensis]|uniref:Type IV pilus assembly protein PilM n=1 Tax=Roseibacillus ishigakijimensis TaxID=454146 RepID=A0A934VLM1_9BACT|nr:type IV pilus assembly protein PilM [Roseibacillus ishigakijimensis]MBK1834829.1 type IV pilus assembly protein PilM [Roseibacillus ishigakijimensis]